MIDLIVKPTDKCNFACKFCSSNNISSGANILEIQNLLDIIDNNTNTVIINGGDPLMVDPYYYLKIVDHLDQICSPAYISITTNLWDFYMNPDKWVELFKINRVKVTTSFQYGDERILKNGEVFTEYLFRKVIDKFEKYVGYKPMFISVITKNNDIFFNKHAELAKELGVRCKINYAFKSGRQSEFYPLAKYYDKLVKLFNTELECYVKNVGEIKKVLLDKHAECPNNRLCYKNIRSISPDGIITTCGAFGDDYYNGRKILDDLEHRIYYTTALKSSCFSCKLFNICNGCFKTILDYKEVYNNNQIEEHCINIKKIFVEYI